MNNTKLYPFERNRYYAGKMLTSADFQAEQTYFNNKRRFVNNLMYGSGVVCGCGVFSLDDLSLLVESGVAIDGLGREIVVESSVVKKLSAIEGFENLRTDEACLCLRYREEPIHTVYTVNQGTGEDGREEYEYNRISESYQLFLMDREDDAAEYEMESEFFTSLTLFEDEDFLVKLSMPATVCRGKNVRLELIVQKLSSQNRKLSYRAVLQTPVFLTSEGTHELSVEIRDASLVEGETLKKDYWLHTQEAPVIDTSILVESGTAHVSVDGVAKEAPSGSALNIALTDMKPGDLVSQELGRISLEMKSMGGAKDYVCLADLKLVRTENAYIIEEVLEKGIKNYIMAPSQSRMRSQYMEYFSKDPDIFRSGEPNRPAAGETGPAAWQGRAIEAASGVLEIPLGENARRGDVRYSGEIMHGLGKGNVHVEIGYEYIAEDPALGITSRNTIYGNPKLFRDEQLTAVDVETAVKVMNDKGSFIVAAKLLENVNYLVLTYRWVAIRFPAGNDLDRTENYSDRSISVDTPTVVMGTRENFYFHVRYNNMEACSIAYELTEPGSGEITSDGVYTSPAKEGVYEIRVYCVDMPVICTYAYAIVKKTGAETEEP
ncbi:MAG: hypothetical protein LUC98_06160 [Lachnospiraceae bacterium]|nr:hypothetical protein [Lachnospiraceae bacterium]